MSHFITGVVGFRRTGLIDIQNQDGNPIFSIHLKKIKPVFLSSETGICCLFKLVQQLEPKCLLPSQSEQKRGCVYTAL